MVRPLFKGAQEVVEMATAKQVLLLIEVRGFCFASPRRTETEVFSDASWWL